MKVMIDGFELEINAKFVGDLRNSKKAALSFLNTLSILYDESSRLHKQINDPVNQRYAEIQEDRWLKLYSVCEKEGLYKFD